MRILFAGMFCLVVLFPGAGHAGDVTFFGVSKVVEYAQTPSGPPAVVSDGYSFTAFAVGAEAGRLTNATVRMSNSQVTNALLPQAGTDMAWLFQERFNSQPALDAAYPNGTLFDQLGYVVTLFTANDGVRSSKLNLWTVLGGYPATPTLTHLEAAQDIDATAGFTLTWNSLGGSSLDIVQLTILDGVGNLVFTTPAPFEAGALNGGSTSVEISPGRLPPGAGLIGNLLIARPGWPDTSYGTGVPAFSKTTTFALATRAVAPARPLLSITSEAAGPRITFTTESSRTFHLQASEDLAQWSTLLITNPLTPTVTFTDSETSQARLRFYRVVVPE